LYSIVSLLGKASFFIAAAFTFVMLPIMSKDKEKTSANNRKGLVFFRDC
jgi:O-antigen/teichoic acid export membrane protein